ncbi:probable LRR receptor-like serine/threonine-protein kinase At1g63430 [Nymphaea colorata]|nr:probable LRR receptor-like serine/threonine-protein kinase At1g63430 [Nymphaea colorata]
MGKERKKDRSPALLLLAAILGLFSHCVDATDDVSALLAFKESIYDDPFSRLSNWNSLDEDPCNWSGVVCRPGSRSVTSLNLPSSSLCGFLAPELGLLTSLQALNLSRNNILGIIPKQIGRLSELKILDLSGNQLSGTIPNEVGNLTSIMKIYLQHNQLTGNLPPELGKLRSLVEVKLNKNRLQGPLSGSYDPVNLTDNLQGLNTVPSNSVGFCQSPNLKVADFSDNFFIGRIPSCLDHLPRSSFRKNCFLDRDSIIQRSIQQCGASKYQKGHPTVKPDKERESTQKASTKCMWLLAVKIATGVIAGSLFLYIVGIVFVKCKDKKKVKISWKKISSAREPKELAGHEVLKGVLKISRQELEVACEEFSNIIGSSPDSVVYKGTMKGGPEIAVISLCISEDSWTSFRDLYFQRQVAGLARLNHENTAKLIGYCSENYPFSRMLIFEYASNGTLYEHLHYGEGCQLSWTRRMKIIVGVACGLRYMHYELQPAFTLLELNSSAVYLTEDFSPKLVDFESWKAILSRSGSSCLVNSNGNSTELVGRICSDMKGIIFSFGVLLLEIISGRPPYCKDKGFLVDWAREYLEMPEVISCLVDPQLKYFRHEDIKVVCEVVTLCIRPEPTERPSINILCSMLENGIDVSPAANLKESSLAWAELAISS